MEKAALSECEQMVMKCIWNSEEALGVQELTEIVNQKYGKTWKLQTVSTFLARLVKKGYLEMQRKGRTFFYKPAVKEDVYKKQLLTEQIRFWNGGNAAGLIRDICTNLKFSEKEKKEIKEIVDGMK